MSPLDPRNPLMVPELLCDILDFFRPEFEQDERLALVALAQTCRAFLEPSLNRLWRKLTSLKPLVRCYMEVDDVERAVPPTSSQCATIHRYSHRIRELTISEKASLRFLQCMSMRPCRLFPNLMALTWGTPRTDFASPNYIPIVFIQCFLGPALVSLDATLAEADGGTLLSFFDNYPQMCPNLKSIEFRFASELSSETTIQGLSRAICCQQGLEKAILHSFIDDIALRCLSALPTLKVLSVTLPERSTSHHSFSPTDPLFCNADVLKFSVRNLDLVTELLRPHDQIFHTFRLYHASRQPVQDFLPLLNVLASRSTTAPLQNLTLSVGDFTRPILPDRMPSEFMRYRLSYEILQPLTSLRFLRDLFIEWSEQISLDDGELETLARSWPMLRVFHVYCGRGGYPPYSTKFATLRGLLTLIKACPKLEAVNLPLDAMQIPVVNETDACETNFTCLIVTESPIGQPLPVAEFLIKYLPYVTAVDARFLRPPGTNGEQVTAYEHAWQQVETRLREFHYSCDNDLLLGSDSDSDVSDD